MDALSELRRQLNIINELIEDHEGLCLCSSEVSLADATLFPTMVFVKYMLPKFGVPATEVLPPKINKWFEAVVQGDSDFAFVYDEVVGGLKKWDENGRWDTIWLAGLRDNDPETIFDKIINGGVPSTIVKEDSKIIAFKDINPVAPAHVLVIPKNRDGLNALRRSSEEHIEILGRLLNTAGEIARDESLGFKDGARFVINDGEDGGQEIPHLHIHVIGGRLFTWPPG